MLSIIIVNYNSLQQLTNCLQSLAPNLKYSNYEVIVVNNDSASIKLSFPEIDLSIIEIGQNIGFGAACNIGTKSAKGSYLLFLNPDSQIIKCDAPGLVNIFENNPAIGIIGAEIRTEKNLIQPWSYGKDPTLWQTLKNNVFPPKISAETVTRLVDWVSGAALIIKKDLFVKQGGFDEKFFLYFEDLDLCKRVRNNSKLVLYSPQFKIKHLGGTSFESVSTQKTIYYKSQDLYFLKHFGKTTQLFLKIFRLFH